MRRRYSVSLVISAAAAVDQPIRQIVHGRLIHFVGTVLTGLDALPGEGSLVIVAGGNLKGNHPQNVPAAA